MKRDIAASLLRILKRPTPAQLIFNDDVFLVSYPKSGNTWISFLLANVMCIESDIDVEVNFFNLHDFIPEYLHQNHFALRMNGIGRFPRIIKSHNEVNPIFHKVILIVRDPRDVMVSYWHYLVGQGLLSPDIPVKDLVLDKHKGIEAWSRHTRGWMERASEGKRVQIFRYEDFLKNPIEQLSKVFNLLGYTINPDALELAVKNSSIDVMKKLELTTRRSNFHLESNKLNFVRRGAASQGSDLDGTSLEYINDLCSDLMRRLGYIE